MEDLVHLTNYKHFNYSTRRHCTGRSLYYRITLSIQNESVLF